MNTQLQTTDADAIAEPAERINEQHRLAISHRDFAIQHAAEAGRILLQVKQRLGHGEFMPWIETNCDFAQSTASRYIRAAQQISTGIEISSLTALFPSGRKTEKPEEPTPTMKASWSQPSEKLEEKQLPPNSSETVSTSESTGRAATLSDDKVQVSDDKGKVSETARTNDIPQAKQSPPDVAEDAAVPDLPDDEELERIEEDIRREIDESVDRLLGAAGVDELKRQAAEIVSLRRSRDGFMNGKGEIIKLLKAEQAKVKSLGR